MDVLTPDQRGLAASRFADGIEFIVALVHAEISHFLQDEGGELPSDVIATLAPVSNAVQQIGGFYNPLLIMVVSYLGRERNEALDPKSLVKISDDGKSFVFRARIGRITVVRE